MTKPLRKKVCIVVLSLAGGGAERSSAILSLSLEELGFDVHVVSVVNDIKYKHGGTLLNLGLIKEKNAFLLSKIKRFKVLYNYIRSENFDYIIDNRTRAWKLQEYFISKWLYQPKRTIYCVRSAKLERYLFTSHWFARLCFGNCYKIVGVSETITKRINKEYKFTNLVTINNPVEVVSSSDQDSNTNSGYILFFGRFMDRVKNISLLLEAFDLSGLHEKSIKLVIMGEGEDELELKNKAQTLKSKNYIEFKPFNPNPNPVIAGAIFTVLTSRFEGFPRMILESLALGTPVISVDCESGPNEIIKDRVNGLLVRNNCPVKLAEAMNEFIMNKPLYEICKSNAQRSIFKYRSEAIAKQWEAILK